MEIYQQGTILFANPQTSRGIHDGKISGEMFNMIFIATRPTYIHKPGQSIDVYDVMSYSYETLPAEKVMSVSSFINSTHGLNDIIKFKGIDLDMIRKETSPILKDYAFIDTLQIANAVIISSKFFLAAERKAARNGRHYNVSEAIRRVIPSDTTYASYMTNVALNALNLIAQMKLFDVKMDTDKYVIPGFKGYDEDGEEIDDEGDKSDPDTESAPDEQTTNTIQFPGTGVNSDREEDDEA